MASLENYRQIAVRTAEQAGKLLQEYFGKVKEESIEEKMMGDYVSEADKASEDLIITLLENELPTHDILSEERGLITRSENSQYRWIIDPLDGTTNFIRGFPIWAVSVGLEDRSDTNHKWGPIVAGAISIPALNETYSAALGCGSFRNGTRFHIGKSKLFKDSLLATGFPFRTRHLIDTYNELFKKILKKCADIRRPGAVAVDLCYVANGTFDGFWELDLAPWDLAAGAIIIREAGGKVANFQGNEDFLTTGDIVAGHPDLYPQLRDLVRSHFPLEREVDKSPKP